MHHTFLNPGLLELYVVNKMDHFYLNNMYAPYYVSCTMHSAQQFMLFCPPHYTTQLHIILHIAHYTTHRTLYYTLHIILHIAHYTTHCTLYTLHSIHYTSSVHYTVHLYSYTIQYKLCIVFVQLQYFDLPNPEKITFLIIWFI